MKKSWYATREGLESPLVLYFIGMILLGVGNLFTTSNEIISGILAAFRYTGGLIKIFFPLFLVINVIGKRHEDSVPIIGGVISYIVLNIVTMFVARQDLPSYYYTSFTTGGFSLLSQNGNRPINLGILASFLVIFIVIEVYRFSRQRFNYGLLRFISNDSWFLIITMLLTVVAGILASLMFPYGVYAANSVMSFINNNSTNPAGLFIYGVFERILEIFGVSDILHSNFWIGPLGGNWLDASGVTYVGDVSIWTAQLAANSIQSGVGKYITPYYVINLAVVPATIIGIYCQFSNKLERRKYLGLALLAIATSFISSSLVPLEYLLLFISPMLLVGNSIIIATLYGVFLYLDFYLGYSYSGILLYATPGTLVDLIRIISRLGQTSLTKLFTVSAAYLLVCFGFVWLYFDVLVQDFLEPKKKLQNRKEIIRALGGISNIRIVDGSPFDLRVSLYDNRRINQDALLELGAIRVKETYYCYIIEFGPGSVSLYRQIKKELKAYEKCQIYLENV